MKPLDEMFSSHIRGTVWAKYYLENRDCKSVEEWVAITWEPLRGNLVNVLKEVLEYR